MATPFLAEVKIISFSFPPKGWAFCNGQLLPVNQNQGLFSLLGTAYGGNGQTTFALPDLQGRAALHTGQGLTLGTAGGEPDVTLDVTQLPAHVHFFGASGDSATTNDPASNLLANSSGNVYSGTVALTSLSPSSVSNVGGSQPHPNVQPSLVLNFVIALQGILPGK